MVYTWIRNYDERFPPRDLLLIKHSVCSCTSVFSLWSNQNIRDVLSANGEIIEAINDVAASQGNAICACVIVS